MYCSDGFVALTGFNRKDIMSKNCNCSFMYGDLTEKRVKMDFNDALLRKQALQTEIICYRSDGTCYAQDNTIIYKKFNFFNEN